MTKTFIVDSETNCRSVLRELLEHMGHRVTEAEDGKKAMATVCSLPHDLIILDINLPKLHGLRGVRTIREECPDLPILLLTSASSIEMAVDAMKFGVSDYLIKPINLDEARMRVQKILHERQLTAQNTFLLRELAGRKTLDNLIGATPAIKEIHAKAAQIAQTDKPVLICGENGTGKEFLARAIHNGSRRSFAPFIKVNSIASNNLQIARKLFGEEKNDPSGNERLGRVDLANGGVIFINEITRVEPEVQEKLLQMLKDKSFERVGGSDTIRADVRLIAATTCSPTESTAQGKLHNAFFEMLSDTVITLPPLRDRREDIPALVRFFISRYAAENGKSVTAISESALSQLTEFDWKANIRELENCIERSVLVCNGDCIMPSHLALTGNPSAARRKLHNQMKSLRDVERDHIRRVLTYCNWNRSTAATILEIDRKTLRSKIREFGFTPPPEK